MARKKSADQRDRLGVAEGLRPDDLRRLHQLQHRDGREERRLLEERDQVVAERRHHRRDRLRDDDVAEGGPGREVQRDRRLPLAAGDVVEAGAIDLGAVGGVVDADRQHPGDEGVDHHAELREDEVDEEDLDQERRGADQLHDHRDRPGGGGDGDPHRREHQAEQRGDDEAEQRRLDGDDGGLASTGRISKAKDQSQIIAPAPAPGRARRASRAKRMPMVRTSDSARYMSRTRVKIGTVWKVVWFNVCALKVRSASVMSETSEVAFRSSMKRLPQGGIIATKACGRMMRRSALGAGHVERGARLPLAAVHPEDGAAHHLRAVGADVQPERQHRDGEGRDGDAELRQHEEQPEELHQGRGAAEDLDIGRGEPAQRRGRVHPGERRQDAHDDREQAAEQRRSRPSAPRPARSCGRKIA